MQTLSVFRWGAILFALALGPAIAGPPPELAKQQEQMFAVSGQLNGNCSSTLIHSKRDDKSGDVTTLFLTAKHCIEGSDAQDMVIDLPVYQDARVVKFDRYIARVKAQSYKADLAILVLKDKETYFGRTARLAAKDGDLWMGEPVWTVGYPLGMALTVTEGLFGSRETIDFPSDGIEYFRATPDIAPGNSGGALYHRSAGGDYELLGVTTAGFRGLPYIALYTPIEEIYDFLKVSAPEAIGLKQKPPVGATH